MKRQLILLSMLLLAFGSVFYGWSAVPLRYCKDYEKDVRVLVIYNDAYNVGGTAKNLVKDAMSTCSNIKVRKASNTSWAHVISAFSPNLPEVIVHVNGGWQKYSGPNITHFDEKKIGRRWEFNWMGHTGCPNMDKAISSEIIVSAYYNQIGVVAVGDDAPHNMKCLSGFKTVHTGDNVMKDGSRFDQPWELWTQLEPSKDPTGFPGIIKNAVKILKDPNNRMYFRNKAGSEP
ncbi:MAG: hypothetical protein HQK83_13485, partial [Fibrobacteria bacterium]|nr:hypothetical protein [Fibrobacteria bacterium]